MGKQGGEPPRIVSIVTHPPRSCTLLPVTFPRPSPFMTPCRALVAPTVPIVVFAVVVRNGDRVVKVEVVVEVVVRVCVEIVMIVVEEVGPTTSNSDREKG